MSLRHRKAFGNATTDFSSSNFQHAGAGNGEIDNIRDNYYSTPLATNDENFYKEVDTLNLLSGHEKFQLDGITTLSLYNNLYRAGLCFKYTYGALLGTNAWCYIYELNVMLEKTSSIRLDMYTPFLGRIFNDTWDSRKTAADPIANPVDMIEHVLRLGNWSENQVTPPAAGWGKAYADNPAINTATTEGGFDYSGLNFVKLNGDAAFQVLSESDATGDKIIRQLCQEWFLGQFQNADGEESISYLPFTGDTTTSLTLADITPGSIGDIIEPRQEDVFIEPFIRYDWDPARNKFNKAIRVTNTSAETFDSSYVDGLGAVEGEEIWNKCKTLAQRFRIIYTPPSELTDLKTIKADFAAKIYLETWIEWMQKKRLPFSVPYTTGRLYFVTKHLGLTLPHQTNSVKKEVLIESLERDKNNNRVNMTVVFLDEIDETAFRVQDVPTTPNIKDDWQDVVTTPNVENDIQDTPG
jgi:hypothetical protein